MDTTFTFNPGLADDVDLGEPGEYSDSTRTEIAILRGHYPELMGWGDLAFGSAWGAYSQDIYAVSWVDWLQDRDNGFLAYLFIRTKNPHFEFGGTGLFDQAVWDFGDTQPWITDVALPDWATSKATDLRHTENYERNFESSKPVHNERPVGPARRKVLLEMPAAVEYDGYAPDIDGGIRRVGRVALPVLLLLALLQLPLWWKDGLVVAFASAVGTIIGTVVISRVFVRPFGRMLAPHVEALEVTALLWMIVSSLLSFTIVFAVVVLLS